MLTDLTIRSDMYPYRMIRFGSYGKDAVRYTGIYEVRLALIIPPSKKLLESFCLKCLCL